MVFQDPNAALNPAMTVEEAVGDALRVHGMRSASERRAKVIDALERVGLSPVELFLEKYPRDLSGGQKQRVVIARAIVTGPSVLVADEPISMLDMSVRAKILQPAATLDLQQDLGLTYVYITHDLAEREILLRTGSRSCTSVGSWRSGATEEIFANRRHPYTKALLRAIPDPDPGRRISRDLPRGEAPDAADPPLRPPVPPRAAPRRHRSAVGSRATCAPGRGALEPPHAGQDMMPSGRPSATWTTSTVLQPKPTDWCARCRGDPAFLDRVRAEVPDDPIWTGVEAITDAVWASASTSTPASTRSCAGGWRRGGVRPLSEDSEDSPSAEAPAAAAGCRRRPGTAPGRTTGTGDRGSGRQSPVSFASRTASQTA